MTWHYELNLTDDFTGSVKSKLFSLSNNHDVRATEALCHGRRRPCFDIEALVVETLQHSGWRVWCIRATCYRHSLMTILFDLFLLFDSWFHFGFASPVKRYFNIEDIFKNLMDVHFAGPVDWFESQRMISCVFSKDIQSGSNRRSRWWLQCVDIWSSDKKGKKRILILPSKERETAGKCQIWMNLLLRFCGFQSAVTDFMLVLSVGKHINRRS